MAIYLDLFTSCRSPEKNEYESDGFAVITKKWDTFVQNMPATSKLHFATCRLLGKPRQYYICFGKPTFTFPNKQVKDIASRKFDYECLGYPDKVDKELLK